jgi:hypothetical protein
VFSAFSGEEAPPESAGRTRGRILQRFLSNVFHLYKLHGSVNWERRNGDVLIGSGGGKPLLIYPRKNKFESSYEPPFLDMMAAFQFSLRQPNTFLLAIGFGFNDDHLANPILSAVKANVGMRMAVVGINLEELPMGAPENPFVAKFKQLIAAGDQRLTLVESTFEGFLPVVPHVDASTDEDAHRKRLAELGA